MVQMAIVLMPIVLFPQAGSIPDDAVKHELKRLQGDWNLIRSVREGKEIPAERLRGAVHTFREDRWIPGRDPNDYSTVSLAPKAEPKTIDFKDKSGNLMLGIYKIEGDTLTLCVARSGIPRPERFVSAEGSKSFLIEMKRRAQ